MERVKIKATFRIPYFGISWPRSPQFNHLFNRRPFRRRLKLVIECTDRFQPGLDPDKVLLDDVFVSVKLIKQDVHLFGRNIYL
jgi:hypothetical protein